jgi:hypothetical protein
MSDDERLDAANRRVEDLERQLEQALMEIARLRSTPGRRVFYTHRSNAGPFIAYEAESVKFEPGTQTIQIGTGATEYGAIAALCERMEHAQYEESL